MATLSINDAVGVLVDRAGALDAARELASELSVSAAARDLADEPPLTALRRIATSGLLAAPVPKEYGGVGLSHADQLEIVRVLAVADSSLAQTLLPHFALVGAVAGLASKSLREQVFSEIVISGGHLGNGISERGTKYAWDPQTRIRADGGDIVVSGRKYYATGAISATRIAVLAKDELGRLVLAVVRREAEGVTVSNDWSSFGQRATISGSFVLDDVRISPEDVIPIHQAFEGPGVGGAIDQLIHIAIDVGIARAALEQGAQFIRDHSRPWFESGAESILDEDGVKIRFGDIAARVIGAELAFSQAGTLLDQTIAEGLTSENTAKLSSQVAALKIVATDAAVRTTSDIFELAGTSATDREVGLDRHWRNARAHTLHDPVRWKQFHLGNYLLSGVNPPRNFLN